MLSIRLARIGKKNRAQFQIVVQEHTIAPGGRHVEVLGSYDPHSKQIVLKKECAAHWVKMGAQVSDTVYNILVSEKVIEGDKRKVKLPAKKVEAPAEMPAEVPATEAAPAEAAPAAEEAKAEEAPKEETKAE